MSAVELSLNWGTFVQWTMLILQLLLAYWISVPAPQYWSKEPRICFSWPRATGRIRQHVCMWTTKSESLPPRFWVQKRVEWSNLYQTGPPRPHSPSSMHNFHLKLIRSYWNQFPGYWLASTDYLHMPVDSWTWLYIGLIFSSSLIRCHRDAPNNRPIEHQSCFLSRLYHKPDSANAIPVTVRSSNWT